MFNAIKLTRSYQKESCAAGRGVNARGHTQEKCGCRQPRVWDSCGLGGRAGDYAPRSGSRQRAPPPKDTAAEVDRVGEIDAAIVFGLASGRVYTPGGGLGKVKNGEGLAYINREQIDAIRQAVHELERAGYIVRVRERDSRGRLRGAEYTIYEQPQSVPALPALD